MTELDESFERARKTIECMELKNRSLALKLIVIQGGTLTTEQKAELDDLEIKLRDCEPATRR